MARFIEASTRLEAWMAATEILLDGGPQLNMILSIERPGSDGPNGSAAAALVDEFLRAEQSHPLHTVAEYIFPGWEYRRRGFDGMCQKYADEEYDLIKERWGTYAYRLLRRTTADGQVVNPLKKLIEKMRDEASLPRPKHSCYEIGIAEGEYDMPLYNTTDDQGRRMAGPCLSHVSFKYFNDSVHLTAMYRSQDYRYKALGNLLGLARLQACVAQEVGKPLGSLVVHSTYAMFDSPRVKGRGKEALAALLGELRDLSVVQAVPA